MTTTTTTCTYKQIQETSGRVIYTSGWRLVIDYKMEGTCPSLTIDSTCNHLYRLVCSWCGRQVCWWGSSFLGDLWSWPYVADKCIIVNGLVAFPSAGGETTGHGPDCTRTSMLRHTLLRRLFSPVGPPRLEDPRPPNWPPRCLKALAKAKSVGSYIGRRDRVEFIQRCTTTQGQTFRRSRQMVRNLKKPFCSFLIIHTISKTEETPRRPVNYGSVNAWPHT